MRDYNEAMVDIESLDTEDTAIVYQVGVIVFNQGEMIHSREFNLPIQEQIDAGRTISESTLAFHMRSPAGLYNSMHHGFRDSARSVLEHLTQVAQGFKPKYWWSKGDFDYSVLEDLFGGKDQVPWQWYQKMELRTMIRETDIERLEANHTAVRDCLIQLAQLNECRRVIDGATRSEGEEGDIETGAQSDTE